MDSPTVSRCNENPDAENLTKVRKALEKGLSVAEIVELTGISLSSVKHHRKHLQPRSL